ncbi:hypothetical protein [Pseudomonas sp. TH31]|uniref:hypothetical protein n=1 Tax=Pseudomonas sp. TH31 TaxID=2796396 RepID=UPI001912A568|nr:hypothetical protein [Pseudomonas sp. TH31]
MLALDCAAVPFLSGIRGRVATQREQAPRAFIPFHSQRGVLPASLDTHEMLAFCAQYNIVADVEVIAMSEINEAFERLEKGEVLYRFVVDMQQGL